MSLLKDLGGLVKGQTMSLSVNRVVHQTLFGYRDLGLLETLWFGRNLDGARADVPVSDEPQGDEETALGPVGTSGRVSFGGLRVEALHGERFGRMAGAAGNQEKAEETKKVLHADSVAAECVIPVAAAELS